MKDDRLFVGHMLDCIAKIEAYTASGYAAYSEGRYAEIQKELSDFESSFCITLRNLA